MKARKRSIEMLHLAYEGFETPDKFASAAELGDYREYLLERTRPMSEFIKTVAPDRCSTALELACGNGRLLIDLRRRNLVDRATGIDIAESRISFADRWASETGVEGLDFITGDVLSARLDEEVDLALCITGALAYFEPVEEGLAVEVLTRLHGSMRPGGVLVLELYPHPRERLILESLGGSAMLWKEMPVEDVWRFYLSSLKLDFASQVLDHEKTFIHRESGVVDEGRTESLLLYTEGTIVEALSGAGFTDISLHEGWSEMSYSGGDVMVAVARRDE